MRVDSLYVYPVKGLSAQPLDSVDLAARHGFPFDREFALARRNGRWHPGMPVGLPKSNYLMLMRDERLAEARTHFDPATGVLTAEHPDGGITADLGTERGRADFALYFGRLAGLPEELAPLVAHDPGRRYTDVARRSDAEMHSISFVNRATIRDLEERAGVDVDPLRFRANVYLDGEPFVERDLVDAEFTVGNVRFRWVRATTRCPATEVDPGTGVRDLATIDLLREHHGAAVMGFYAQALTSGTLWPGDPLVVE